MPRLQVLQLDETEGLLAALAARSSEVPDQPSPVQAPAAVWLPHGSAAGAAGGRREEPPPPPAPSLLSPSELASWAVYRAQRLGTEPLPAKLAAYFVVGAPLVAVCAVLYSMVSGKPLARGLAQSFGNLYKVCGPGFGADERVLNGAWCSHDATCNHIPRSAGHHMIMCFLCAAGPW